MSWVILRLWLGLCVGKLTRTLQLLFLWRTRTVVWVWKCSLLPLFACLVRKGPTWKSGLILSLAFRGKDTTVLCYPTWVRCGD